ncbi:DUF3253 domain-containing protein [Acetobacteraceae bacterium KSS8]|uniref:DUF3253 domain-containing protein n=1 Tax=Endosaccharibacter trunci TaxID=2812733 RepID=A0ABT1W7Q2_9PROT|nr:DUF3253 domain-containing protein [Acetobacteraceae bacterium KSS8]
MATEKPKVPAPDVLRAEILRQTAGRGADKSICPSEVARNYGEDWQRLMTPVRNAARALAKEGVIDILRKGKPIEPDEMRGVIRLRIRRTDGSAAEET